MLKWAVGTVDGRNPAEATPRSSYRQSIRRTAEKFHLIPSTSDLQQPVRRAVIRTLVQDGKENGQGQEEAPHEKRSRDRSLLTRLRGLSNTRTPISHDTRGPLGDVTNQSPVPSPRSATKGTPARSRSRLRKNLARAKSTDGDMKVEATKSKCSTCNSTPRRIIPKRTPKRRKQHQPEYNVSPLKPSDLCIDYSPDFSDSLLALRRRLEETMPSQHDNPLYFSLKPRDMEDNPLYMSISPVSRRFSNLNLQHDVTDPRFLQHSTLIESAKTRHRRHSETQLKSVVRRRRYSETMLQSDTDSGQNSPKLSELSMEVCAILSQDSDYSPPKFQDMITASTETIPRINTLPTPRLTPDLLASCWRHSSSSTSEFSALGETWDSHRLHTILLQQNKAALNALIHESDTPPAILETKSLLDETLRTDISDQIRKATITDLLKPNLPRNLSQPNTRISEPFPLPRYLSQPNTLLESKPIVLPRNVLLGEPKPLPRTISNTLFESKPIALPRTQSNTLLEYKPIPLPKKSNIGLESKPKKSSPPNTLLESKPKKSSPPNPLIESQPKKSTPPIDSKPRMPSPCEQSKVVPKVKILASECETPNMAASFSQEIPESTESPLALVERSPRSRKCLLYASPSLRIAQPGMTPCLRNRKKRKAKSGAPNRGEVRLSLYQNVGLLTVHVISATNLPQRDATRPASAFIKLCLLPRRTGSGSEGHRTNVRRAAPGPSGGAPIYRFDQKFSLEVPEMDADVRVLVSVWLRPRAEKHRKSECVGCMSFGVQDVFKNELRGTFLVLSPSAGRTQYVSASRPTLSGSSVRAAVMAEPSDSSADEAARDLDTPKKYDRRRSSCRKSYPSTSAVASSAEDSTFLRHLELEAPGHTHPGSSSAENAQGRTPFTVTRKLARKPGSGFGFSVAWTQPPRVERVEAGLPADKAGLRPGDYVIFVGSHNVVTMPEEEILNLIKMAGNNLTLEVYRRTTPNCAAALHASSSSPAPKPPPAQRRAASVTDCSAATSLDLRRRLQLPQVAFSSEGGLTAEEARRRAVYQLLQRLQAFALAMHFGVDRFLVPLADRKDLLSSPDHLTLFQNIEELLMLTEEILEQLFTEDPEHVGNTLGRIYLNKIQALTTAYRKYCLGLKKADCLLAQKARSPDFLRVTSEPPVPKRRPDLTTFIHKPLEHYRETLKLLQTVLKHSKVNDEEYAALSKVVQALQTTYRDITANSGLMEPDGGGRPLLSLQDLESRLVFTKCKPFALSGGGRQWIFGGDLARVDGRSLRPFWALLFTDLLLLAKVSRDRVLFVTDEPISLLHVTQACFSVKKKDTEFRLILDGVPQSPGEGGKGAKAGSSTKTRRRSVAFRAPTPELKAVWQNLLQRQIIYLNTVRGGTPTASPLDSPAEQPSLATMDSSSRLQLGSSQRHLDQFIEQKCRLLGKSGVHKGSALHLQQWMTGQLGAGQTQSPVSPEEPEPEVWSPGTLRRRGEQLAGGGPKGRCESRAEDIELSSPDPERSPSRSTDDSLVTVKSGGFAIIKNIPQPSTSTNEPSKSNTSPAELNKNIASTSTTTAVTSSSTSSTVKPTSPVAMCKNCLENCAQHPCPSSHRSSIIQTRDSSSDYDSEEGDRWEPLPSELGISLQNRDPFCPQGDLPVIAVLPPTPSESHSVENTPPQHGAFEWEGTTAELVAAAEACALPDEDDETDEDLAGEDGNPPYRTLSNSNLRKYGTLTSLENLAEAAAAAAAETETADEDTERTEGDEDLEEASSYATVKYERSEASVTTTSSGSSGAQLVHVASMKMATAAWTRGGVAERTKMFERISEQSKENHVSIERFLPKQLTSTPITGFNIPRTISSSCFIPGNEKPNSPPKSPPKALPRLKKQTKNGEPTMPRTVASQSKEHHDIPTPATVAQPIARHTVVMGTTATLKNKAPAVPVRSKIYAPFKPMKQQAPPIPSKPLELTSKARPKSPEMTSSAAAAAAIAAANQVGSPDTSVSDKEEWGTPEENNDSIHGSQKTKNYTSLSRSKSGGDPDDTEEELSSTQDIVSLFPCVGSDEVTPRAWSPDDDDQLTRLLSAPPRVFPRRRLEPLYEEDGDGETCRPRPRLLSDSSSSGHSSPERPRPKVPPRRGCMVPGQGSWADVCADIQPEGPPMGPNSTSMTQQGARQRNVDNGGTRGLNLAASSGLLRRLKLASSRHRRVAGGRPLDSAPPSNAALRNKLLGNLLGNNRSEDVNNGNTAGRSSLLRLFGNTAHTNSNNINNGPTNTKEGSSMRPDQDKILDRRFWKQLKRRRSGSLNSSNPPIAV